MSRNRFYQYTYQNARQDAATALKALLACENVLIIYVFFANGASGNCSRQLNQGREGDEIRRFIIPRRQ